MAYIQEYITWVPFHGTNGIATHINPNMTRNWNIATTTELSYGNTETDKRMLGIVGYDDTVFLADHKTRYTNEGHTFGVTFITAAKALELCNEWYPSGEDPAYFTLDVDGFTLIDGRPEEPL